MTLSQFIAKYNGQHLEATGNPVGSGGHDQCVDVAVAWAKNLGKGYYLGNAIGWARYIHGWKWVNNTPNGVPKNGSIVVWNASKSNGYCGHVGVFINGGVWTFNSFDQNWPTGSVCHTQYHNYIAGGGVKGWQSPL